METLHKLRPDHWAWLHAKAAMLIWAALFFAFTPLKVFVALDFWVSTAISLFVVFGILVSVIGLVKSTSNNNHVAHKGLNLELTGLWFAIAGPFAYCVTQFYLTFGIEGDQRIALVAFAYALCSFMLVRIVIVTTHRRRVTI